MSESHSLDAATASGSSPMSAYLVLGVGLFAVSCAAIFIRYAQSDGLPSLLIAASRLIIATLVLTPFAFSRYRDHLTRLRRGDLLLAALSGFFLALHFVTWVSSLEYTSVLISVVLVATTPLWVALLEVLVLKVRLGWAIIAGFLISMFGGILIGLSGGSDGSFLLDQQTLTGAALSLIGAVTVSAYLIIGRRLRAQLPLVPYIWLVYGAAAMTLLFAMLISGTPVLGYTPSGYLWLLALGLIPQLIGHSSFNYALGYVSATFVSLVTQVEPVASAILALIIFQEIPRPLQIVGSIIILVGVIVVIVSQSFGSIQNGGKRKQA